jgi:hypothetical protein
MPILLPLPQPSHRAMPGMPPAFLFCREGTADVGEMLTAVIYKSIIFFAFVQVIDYLCGDIKETENEIIN